MIEAYPLHWPANKPRTPKIKQKRANFYKSGIEQSTYSDHTYRTKKDLTVAEAVSRVLNELSKYSRVGHPYRVPPDSIIISTNIPVNRNGLPFSDRKQPGDVGVAVYFKLDDKNYCLPCDKWDRVADNIAAIAAHIGAMRGIERWGVAELHEVYTGFKALPEKATGNSWWDVLGISQNASTDLIKVAYKELAKILHPDTSTGNTDAFVELNNAYQQALTARNAK